jgi:hypothetical protein
MYQGMEMSPAEAFSILQRARVKKRWATASDEEGAKQAGD